MVLSLQVLFYVLNPAGILW